MTEIKPQIDRIPPQNLEAEASVLGAIMLDRDAIIKIADTLSPEDLIAPLAAAFARILRDELHPASLTEEEVREARSLAAAKYASPVWTARR